MKENNPIKESLFDFLFFVWSALSFNISKINKSKNYFKKYNYIIDLYDYYDKIMEKLIEILKGKKEKHI